MVPASMHCTPLTDAVAEAPLARVPGLRKENSTLTPVRLPLRATGVSYTRTTVPVRVSAMPGKEITAAAPGVRAAASSREKGTVSFRLRLSTTWATGVPAEIMSPTWTFTAVTEPEAWETTVRSAQAAWAWLRDAWALSTDS